MSRYAILVVILFAVTAFAFAQQMPGRWKYPPGWHVDIIQKDEEIARLNELVAQQNKKILLLEEKVRLLEEELKKSKEATR